MKLVSPLILTILLITIGLQYNTQASESPSFAKNIFIFHKKLADNGNRLSQYKLGTMYELGLGTATDINEATRWYTISAEQGHSSANDRLTYLQIQKNGYIDNKYGNWLKQLRSQAQSNDPDSIFLLGQLYQHGIGVDKNTNQAMLLYKKAGSMGMIESDLQVEILDRELASQKTTKATNPKSKAPAKKSNPEEISKEEKRRRYQEAMKKLKQEQRIIEQQQKWVESQ